LYGAENRTLQKVDQKYLERFEKWYWRRMEWINWTNGVKKLSITWSKGARNTLHTINRRKDNWIGHILHRNCLLEHITEGKIEERIEVIERQGRRHKQTLDTSRKHEDTGN